MTGYWNSKTDKEIEEELLNQLSVTSFDFIGKFRKHNNGFSYFDNVRLPNFSPFPKIRSNIDNELINSKVMLRSKDLKIDSYYHFSAKIIPHSQRLKYNNDFLFTVENENQISEYLPDAKNFTESIYERFYKADSANNNDILKALNTITYQINKKPETFIYELLQNADDNSITDDVRVTFFITDKYLLVSHNGEPFKFNNVFAICSVNAEDKFEDIDKIGFKGIGFKSVFKDNDMVFIKSGNYNFRFDRSNYSVEKPWQLMPIWSPLDESLEKSIRNNSRFLSQNVAIALKPKGNNLNLLSNYSKTLELFNDDRILLFLRNVRQVHVSLQNNEKIDCKKNNDKWGIKNYSINVRKEIKTWLNEQIRNNNQEVPSKYQDIEKFKITFAYAIENKKIVSLKDSTLFNYLPLSISLGFPFLVNADFIPDGDREELHLNLWNEYLMIEIGRYLPIFIANLSDKKIDCLNLLPDLYLDNFINAKWNKLYNWFLNGYEEAIKGEKAIAFIPTISGKLETLSNIIVDDTGLSLIMKDDFSRITNLKGVLINPLGSESTSKVKMHIEKFREGTIYKINDLIEGINEPIFRKWLSVIDNNILFLNYLSKHNLLNNFSNYEVFLAEDGELYKGNDLFVNLGTDANLLHWLGYQKILHYSVLKEMLLIQLPLKEYEPISFIKEIICKERKNEVIESLKDGSISFDDFYNYLSKYSENQMFPFAEIKEFPIKCRSGILKNWSFPIYYSSPSLNSLLANKALPLDLFYLLDDQWNIESNKKLNELALKLNVLTFSQSEPYNFVKAILMDKKEQIFRFYLTDSLNQINANAVLWSFIISSFNNLSEPQKELVKTVIKTFPVLSKKNEFKELNTLYLPSEYTDNDSLEKLIVQFPNANIEFVSSKYLQYPIIVRNEIKVLFKRLDAKIDTKDFLLHTLLPNLHQLSDELFVPVTKLIYENRESEQIINLVLSNNNFKLKTKEGTFKKRNECFIGSPYINEVEIPNPLDFVPIIDQLSAEYSENHPGAWRNFFVEKLKINSLINEQEILSLKLKDISLNVGEWQTKEKSTLLFTDLYFLFKAGKLTMTGNNLVSLKKIPLLCKGSDTSFVNPSMIHFASCFKPIFDFELLFGSNCGVYFLADVYKFEENKEVVLFFEHIGVIQNFERTRHSSLLLNIPTINGLSKPANQLFKYEFKKIVGNSNVALKDLSNISHNGKTLEEYLGFISKLTVSSILDYILKNQPDKRELKHLIIELIKVYNYNDANQIANFNRIGKLLTTAKTYNSVGELNWIDESIRSGIRENEYLIDPLFGKNDQERERYFKIFNIKKLVLEDFNPVFENIHSDSDFERRVNERLVFLAFDNDIEKYLEIENEFKEKLENWKIKKCSKISLKYPEIESKIVKEDSKTFEINKDKIFYYVGSWSDPRVNPVLVDCFSKNMLGLVKQREFIQDMLLNNPNDIITNFESKGKIVPEEIKKRFRISQPIQQSNDESKNTTLLNKPAELVDEINPDEIYENPFKDISAAEEVFIRSIINGDFELNEKLDANTTAKIKTLMAIRGKYPQSEISDEERFIQAGKDEILVRSAQNGILYLDLYSWGRLSEDNVKVAVYTKNQINFYLSQEELIEFTRPQNKFGIVRMPNPYDIYDYKSLDKISDKGRWHYVFIVNEKTKAAQNYKDIMNLDDYNNYG